MSEPSRLRILFRPIARTGYGHWVRMALLLAAGYYAGHLLSSGEWLTQLRYDVYFRQLRMQQRGDAYPQRTAVVLLNDDDYWAPHFEARRPLKRDQLALLLDRLNQAGADTVVLDIDLRSPLPDQPAYDFPSYATEDLQLMAAVDRMCQAGGHVVLSASVRYSADGAHYEQMPSIYATSQPALPCLHPGYIELPNDMRRLPGPLELQGGKHLDSLALAAVQIADPIVYTQIAHQDESNTDFRFTRFLTEADFATRDGRKFLFSTAEVRDTDTAILHTQLADRIIFVGAHWHTFAAGTGPLVDTFPSPGGRLPGVMLHANYVEAMLDHTGTFTPVSDTTAEILEGLLVLVLGIIGALDVRAIWKWGAFTAGLSLAIVLTYVLLQNLGLFMDFLIPLLMIVVHTLVEEILHMRHQLHHARQKLKEHTP
jgi:CHASE2 domain-containing sensor protein